MKLWLNLSYFIALICVGDVVLLLGLTPQVTALPEEAVALGLFKEAEHAKLALYLLVDVVWTAILVCLWVRNGSLVPTATRPGRRRRSMFGHSMIALGNLTVLSIFFVETMKWLMILPVLVVLVCYVAGIVLIETSRQWTGRARKNASGS